MFEVILYEPEIPPNAGNIMRLCANAGCRLHLVRPLGFSLSDKQLERAGMDYRGQIDLLVHDDWRRCADSLQGHRLFAVTTRGSQRYDKVRFAAGDALVFGPETRGCRPTCLTTSPPIRAYGCRCCPAAAVSIWRMRSRWSCMRHGVSKSLAAARNVQPSSCCSQRNRRRALQHRICRH